MIRRCRNSFLVYLEIAMDNSRRRQTGGCTRAPHNSCPHGSSPPETSNNSPSIRSSLKIVHRYHHHHLSSSASSLSLSYARFQFVCTAWCVIGPTTFKNEDSNDCLSEHYLQRKNKIIGLRTDIYFFFQQKKKTYFHCPRPSYINFFYE